MSRRETSMIISQLLANRQDMQRSGGGRGERGVDFAIDATQICLDKTSVLQLYQTLIFKLSQALCE